MAFVKATKQQSKLRMSISGPSGSGKTWTSLVLATALVGDKRVALIDTERKSASKYASDFDFDVMDLETFNPQGYIDAIHEAERDSEYGVIVIDSLSHAWNGTGGLLEIVDAIAKRKYSNNSFAAWKDATPLQNALIDAITRCKLHIICTMRSKQEYSLEVVNGKSSPKKIGMAPIQREGMEYEFDLAVDMDIDNTMIVQKSRCSALSGQIIAKPDVKVAQVLKTWLEDGTPAPVQEPLSPSVIDVARSEWAVAYKIADNEIEARWERYKEFILKVRVSDPDLKQSQLDTLNNAIAVQLAKAS